MCTPSPFMEVIEVRLKERMECKGGDHNSFQFSRFWQRLTRKGIWFHKTWRTQRDEKNKNSLVNCLITYMLMGPSFHHWRHDKKIKCKCFNEMKCWVYTVLHLVLFLKIKNINLKRPNGNYLKNLINYNVVKQ